MPLHQINRNILILAISSPLILIALFQEWSDYLDLWLESYIYDHGLLVLAGSLFLLYSRRRQFLGLQISFSWLAMSSLIVLSVLLLVAHAGNIKLVRMLLLPLLIVAWGATIWGRPFIKTAGPPIILILFAAPFWDDFSPLLQWLTVAVDERVLSALSIPAEIEEFYITIPSGIFHVANGCSGVKYLMVALYLGAFYAIFTNSNLARTLALVLIAGFLALLSNWIRVAWIIAAGHYTNMESSLVEEHEVFGWVVFVFVTLLPFFLFTYYLEKRSPPNTSKVAQDSGKTKGTAGEKFSLLAASLPLLAIPLILAAQNYTSEHNAARWTPTLPAVEASDWKGPLQFAEFWNTRFHSSDIHLSGVYVSNQYDQIQVDFYGYRQQNQGKELIYYKNDVFDPKQWNPTKKTIRSFPEESSWPSRQANEIIFENKANNNLVIVWYWYKVGSDTATSPTKVKIIGGLKTLFGDQRAAIWILSTACKSVDVDQCVSEGEARFQSFLKYSRPASGS